jgi:hypothetical protein
MIVTSSVALLPLATGASSAAVAPQQSSLESLGSASGNEEHTSHLTAEVNLVEKNDAGDVLSVAWSIENNGESNIVLTWLHEGSYTYSGSFMSGVTASSPETDTRYHPFMDGAGECICSGNISSDFVRNLNPGEKFTYWSLYPVATEVETISVEIPGFDPIEDIPIS